MAREIQAYAGQGRPQTQQPDRTNLKSFINETRTEWQAEHQRGGPDEKPFALRRTKDVACNILNPTVSAQLNRADQGVRDKQNEQQDRTNRKTGHHADGNQQHSTDTIGEIGRRFCIADETAKKAFEEKD